MKIISWNVNGIRSIIGQNASRKYDKVEKDNKLFRYIEREDPDVIMIQETKAEPSQINEELRQPPGYHAEYHACERKKGYSGVVTFSKNKPDVVNAKLGIEQFDEEGRIIETHFDDLAIFNIYFPNGTSGMLRVKYKLEFYDALFEHVEKVRKQGKKIIISGDYNTAHHEIDLARPEANRETSGFMDIERVKLDEIEKLKYIDTFREFTEEGGHYTWWSQRGRARENNVGWRIDYHFVSDDLMPDVYASYHQPDEPGSDHCPIILELNR
jgi:exodeoxyribonuclease-3